MAWLNGSSAEQYHACRLLIPQRDAANNHLGILIVNRTAMRAYMPLAVVVGRNANLHRVAAA